jgi:hypothetical protein
MQSPPDSPQSHSKPVARAILPSNSGHASLRIDFVERGLPKESPDRMTDLEIVVPNWDSGYPPQRCQIKIRGLRLRTEQLRAMLHALDTWLNLPIDQVFHNKFTGAFELGSETRHGRLLLSFGDREGRISGSNPLVSILIQGAMRAECDFVTDQSCMRLFADDLRSAIAATAWRPSPDGCER